MTETAPTGKIFLCYRREDSIDITGRIHDRLSAVFGGESVFMDVDNIPFGVDFRAHLHGWVATCDIVIVVIGDRWLDVSVESGSQQGKRRLDDPADYVRIEIEAALARDIPVIPVLVGRAEMPSTDQLPECLAPLAFRNAAAVRSGRDFNGHVTRLIEGTQALLAGPAPTSNREDPVEEELEEPLVPASVARLLESTLQLAGSHGDPKLELGAYSGMLRHVLSQELTGGARQLILIAYFNALRAVFKYSDEAALVSGVLSRAIRYLLEEAPPVANAEPWPQSRFASDDPSYQKQLCTELTRAHQIGNGLSKLELHWTARDFYYEVGIELYTELTRQGRAPAVAERLKWLRTEGVSPAGGVRAAAVLDAVLRELCDTPHGREPAMQEWTARVVDLAVDGLGLAATAWYDAPGKVGNVSAAIEVYSRHVEEALSVLPDTATGRAAREAVESIVGRIEVDSPAERTARLYHRALNRLLVRRW